MSVSGAVARVIMLPVKGWRLVSKHLPAHCRFYPSCSAYALEALEVHGPGRGTWLAIRRVGRCHPWNPGGIDPVPPEGRPNVRSRRRSARRAETARPVG